MAALVSHAMRRYPATPPEPGYPPFGLKAESSSRVWSSEEGESALSRSMRYADPWLYGSVRAPGGLLLAPAFVLCTCPDYLNGTKRSSKKSPTTCKKCKATRLPFSPLESKFGTVRCYPTTAATATPLRAGTMRVTSSSRPSILPISDPYDVMRRSRLSVTEPTHTHFRARSVSPSKTRSSEARSFSASRKEFKKDYNGTFGRKSILECNINPYELMSDHEQESITMLNGQRIRIKSKMAPPDQDYEEVEIADKKPQVNPKKDKPKKKNKTEDKLKTQEADNKFKSILKKPSAFAELDLEERSPSPSRSSQFYIPMPYSSPRKKVQFLVESETVNKETPEEEELVEDKMEEPASEETAPKKDEEEEKTVCKLRRSVSERFKQEPAKVIFHDTMALRTRSRSDSRMAFSDKDPEKLDGINRIRKLSPVKPRPNVPPPPPPEEAPPLAPPRKRSGQRQSLNVSKIEVKEDYSNRTIVEIKAPTIHKLQIKNEFDGDNLVSVSVLDNPQRKTSILINGDDCYSTVNVNDDVPLYQSSVVVKDCGVEVVSKRSSSVYISSESKSSELLEELLKNPVEAVKRNLVPHVCGKSDANMQPDKLEEIGLNYDHDDACSEHSSSTQYELMDPGSDCYTDHSNRSSVTEEELANRNKFYELLADSALIEVSESEDHHYESIKVNSDPIYEEIEIPPPLPSNPPPATLLDDLQLDKEFTTRSIFEGASKYDILSYLVDAKERGIVQEDYFALEEGKDYSRNLGSVSDSSEDNSLILRDVEEKQKTAEVERNDSGVGSETSKSSLSKYRREAALSCEDCEGMIEKVDDLICKKCVKRRTERKEIITEIVETEEKYSRDLQIILEEFYQPMLVAGLLTPDQLSAIFLNVEELLENSQALAERLRDAVEIALEQGDDDLLTVNIGKLFMEAAPMLHAFETYCVRQGAASLLLASLEKDKELLRIFLRVSQMENTMLRRMNLNSFLMVPVQRVTKYPLLLARLYKVTPVHHETREQLKEAQHKIELHLNHMNSETKDVPSKLWRRIGSSSGRRSSAEMDLVNIKLRKIAVDVLEWNHEEAKFALEGKLLYTQPADNNWRKGRTIKLSPVNALLVINGKPISANRSEKTEDSGLIFSKHSSVREAALLLVRDKNGRYSLLREPLYLDRCVIAADPAWQSYFEVQELLGKDTFIFKAEDEQQTKTWYRQLQYHAQGMGAWRKRRNALANIMINGMGLRS